MTIQFEGFKSSPKTFLIADTCIEVFGPDAKSYLNSQTTNNVKALEDGHFQFNALLDGSGKLISGFILCQESSEHFKMLVSKENLQSTLERLEKFHISEDFETQAKELFGYVKTHTLEGDFKGSYFFESDSVVLSDQPQPSNDNLEMYQILSGIQSFDGALMGELINNTRFDELAVDYDKGCYPGQETVAKIHTRRGAAYKPVLIVLDKIIDVDSDLQFEKKRVAKFHSSFTSDNRTYIFASLSREFRVENLKFQFELEGKIYSAVIHLFPFISQSKEELAVEFYDEAVEVFQAGDNERALELFKKSIKFNPTYEDAYESLGVLYGRLGHFDKAIELMEKLKELNPKCMMALTNLSLYHMKQGDIETAEKFKSDATLLNFQLLGDEADQKRKAEEVEAKRLAERDKREQMFMQVLDIDPVDAMANNGLGEIAFEKANYMDAKDYFTKALEGDQKYSVAYLGLGKTLVKLSELDNAKEVLGKGVLIASKNGDMMPANEMQALILRIS